MPAPTSPSSPAINRSIQLIFLDTIRFQDRDLFFEHLGKEFNVVVLEENFCLSQRPTVHFQATEEHATVLSCHLYLLVESECQEAISLQEIGKNVAMTEAMLTYANRL